MTPQLRGMIEVLRRGHPQWLTFNPTRIRAAYAFPPEQGQGPPVKLVDLVSPGRARKSKS